MEELYVDWRIVYRLKKCLICRSKYCLQIEESFADERIVCRPKDYSIGRMENDLSIKEGFDLLVKEVSMDRSTICR